MEITHKYPVVVFRKDGQYGAMYSIKLSKKGQDGKYVNGYKSVQFKKGVELENKTKIYIKNAWLDFYNSKDNKTVDYIFINEFEKVEDVANEELKEVVQEKVDPFTEFNNEVHLTDDDLPF